MRLSNSKKQLAKIISENGGWRDGAEFASQGRKTGAIGFVRTRPRRSRDVWQTVESALVEVIHPDVLIPNWHQTILSRDEYFHLYPAPDADGWIEWKSKFYGDIPCDESCIVDIMESDGEIFTDFMAKNWKHWGSVKAYRLHNPEQAKPRFCESVMRSIQEPEVKPTLEQLAAEYRNRQDYAERKQQEADEAKAEAEAKLAELVAAGKAVGLAVSVAAPRPEMVITDWRDLQVWDEVECIGYDAAHRFGCIEAIDTTSTSQPLFVRHANGDHSWPLKWRFIRRPAKVASNA